MKTCITIIALVTLSFHVIAQSALQPNLLKLTVDTTEEETYLIWTTQNEQNSAYFRVEKTIDGISFEPVAIINAIQGNNKTHTYSYQTTDTTNATYRIVLISMEGKTTASNSLPVGFYANQTEKAIAINNRK